MRPARVGRACHWQRVGGGGSCGDVLGGTTQAEPSAPEDQAPQLAHPQTSSIQPSVRWSPGCKDEHGTCVPGGRENSRSLSPRPRQAPKGLRRQPWASARRLSSQASVSSSVGWGQSPPRLGLRPPVQGGGTHDGGVCGGGELF